MLLHCSGCNTEHEEINFGNLKSSPTGKRNVCNEYRKKRREKDKEKIKEQSRKSYLKHKETRLIKNKIYREEHASEISIQRAAYRKTKVEHIKQKNKEYLPTRKAKIKLRRKTDEHFRISEILRSKFNRFMSGKSTTFKNFLNMNIEQFMDWIEFQFDENMNWDNLATYWEFDHILPLSKFDFTKENDQKICFHWSNFQPLSSSDNKLKTNNLNRSLPYYFNSIIMTHRFIQKHKLNLNEYQAVNKSLQWLRSELRYGNNLTDKFAEMQINGQSAAKLLNPLNQDMEKVQRLNVSGLEESDKL